MTVETKQVKNKIVLLTGIGADKRTVELYNFTTFDHTTFNSVSFIRVLCDNRYYYYQTSITSIVCINIYE